MSFEKAVLRQQLMELDHLELAKINWRSRWMHEARPKQVVDFSQIAESTIFFHPGRGWGKTKTLINWICWELCNDPGSFGHLIGATHNDIRYVLIEGESGLLREVPEILIEDYNKTDSILTFYNGSILRGFSAEEPERLRGPQCKYLACDEVAAWIRDRETWDQAKFGHRLGKRSTAVIASTPKPKELIREFFKDKKIRKIGGHMKENADNLSDSFIEQMERLKGTRLGRQELAGDLLDAEELGVVKRSQWKMWMCDEKLPDFEIIVMSIDSAFTEENIDIKKQTSDFTGCSTWGGIREELTKEQREEVAIRYARDEAVARKVIARGIPKILLLDAWQERLGFPELVTRVRRAKEARYGRDDITPLIRPLFGSKRTAGQGRKADLILIEDKGSGISLRQQLRREQIPVVPYNPKRADKLLRLNLCAPLFASGYVWAMQDDVPDDWGLLSPKQFRDWAEPLIGQMCSYAGEGSIEHDDLMDSATQALLWLSRNWLSMDLTATASNVTQIRRNSNPYAA